MSGSTEQKAADELLSSLKRIVSEEPAQNEGAKLVLTPSQRVGLDPKPRAPRPLVLSHSLEAKVTQLEGIIARTDDEWEPDGDDDSDYAGDITAPLIGSVLQMLRVMSLTKQCRRSLTNP